MRLPRRLTLRFCIPARALSGMTMGNGITQQFSFNDRFQLTGLQAGSNLHLGFFPCAGQATACNNNNGNIQSQTIGLPSLNLTQTYTYDNLNRLTQAQETGGVTWSQSFGFDPNGNGNMYVSS